MGARWRIVAKRIRVPLGFAFAALYLWLARPTVEFTLGSLFLVAPGLWLRAYASGYVKKNAELTVTGPYAYTRNPLYLGSMMLGMGFAIASRSLMILGVLAVFFVLIYVPTIRAEEEYLRSHFAAFNEYARRVPRLVPSPWANRLSTDGTAEAGIFDPALYRKHREYNALMGAVAVYGALVLRLYLRR